MFDSASEPSAPSRRLAIVDDDPVLRLALRSAFERAGWQVVGEAADGDSGAALVIGTTPDVVVMDLSMPLVGGVEATRRIRLAVPSVRVVVLTVSDDASIFRAIRAGALGYLVKGTPLQEIVDAVEHALDGGAPISPRVARLLLDEYAQQQPVPAGPEPDLTSREREVLVALAQGLTSAALAAQLCISLHTANAHVRNIYRKLEVTSRAQAVRRALDLQIV